MRERYSTRNFLLRGIEQLHAVMAELNSIPLDASKPLQVTIREPVNVRSHEQNRLYWAIVKKISEQVWLNGITYSEIVWHEHFKQLFLPELVDEVLCSSKYQKWCILPNGQKSLVGSTTELTTKGMTKFIEEVERFAGEHRVVLDEET